jgi:hypothetical protein
MNEPLGETLPVDKKVRYFDGSKSESVRTIITTRDFVDERVTGRENCSVANCSQLLKS